MACPSCGSKLIGKIGARQFYCWACCVEFNQRGNAFEVFELDQDGGLVPQGHGGYTEGSREATA